MPVNATAAQVLNDPQDTTGLSAGEIDAVMSESARRLRAIVGRWRDEDGDRPTALPLARQSEPAQEDHTNIQTAAPVAQSTAPHTAAPPMASGAAEIFPSPQPIAAAVSVPPQRRRRAAPVDNSITAPTPAPEARDQPPPTAAPQSMPAPAPAPEPAPPADPAIEIPAAEAKPRRTKTLRPDAPMIAPPAPLSPPAVHRLSNKGEMWLALLASRRAITAVGWFSCVINILMLAGPLFMLQVYDRVMTSGSIPTLIALLALTTAVYAIIGVLELVRSRIITRIGIEIDQRIGDRIFEASLKSSIGKSGSPIAALRDLDTLRSFVAGPAPMTFFDVWWAPIYLLVIFATHWTLGLSALAGCGLLLLTAYLSDSRSRAPLIESQKSAVRGMEMAETGQRNAETIAAMGMIGSYRQRWQKLNQEALAWQVYASDILGGISSVSKTLRLLLQSVMLAIGAALALKGEISSGSIIAATIIFGRALAPVEQVITHWRSSLKAHDAYKKLEELLRSVPAATRSVALPAPKGHLEVSGLRVAAPGGKALILNNISFTVAPGQMLAVIGPSASGKSSLTRALVGLWPPVGGSVKLDGVEIGQWNSEALGQHIGYLPQDMELFSGSVRENIARFRDDATDDEIVAAATAAHAHDVVMSLPNGYDTELGAFGTHLSGGQRQRIALARALFRNPALVVLDEANANLDRAGDMALAAAIDGMRARGQAIIFVSHRVQAIQQADTLLYIEKGTQKAFGPRAEVLQAISGQHAPQGRRMSDAEPPQGRRASDLPPQPPSAPTSQTAPHATSNTA